MNPHKFSAIAHRDHDYCNPIAPALLERIRRWRAAYLRWGRDTLGFGTYLFHRPR